MFIMFSGKALMKGRSGSMSRCATLVVAIVLFLVSPFAHAEPRPETVAVPETQGGPAPAELSAKPAGTEPSLKPADTEPSPKAAPAKPSPKPARAKHVRAKPAPAKPVPAPVVLDGKTLFHIKETVLSATPAERARLTNERLANLVKDRAFRAESIQVDDDEFASTVVAEGTALLRVFDRDAAAEGMTREALAALYVETIRAAIEVHNKAYTFHSLLFGVIYAAVATGVLVLVLLLYHFLFPGLYARIRDWSGSKIRSVHIGAFEFLHASRIVRILLALARWFRILTTALLVYAWLLYVLSQFPWTRGISGAVIGYILDPLKAFGAAVLASLPDLFVLAVIVVIMRYVIKFARFFFDGVEKGQIVLPAFYADWATPTYKIVRFFILAFALTVAFPFIPGSGSQAFKGVTIFLGVLFSLGSTSTVSNVMGGLSITYMRAFKIGDRVRIGDTVGDVIDQSLLVTHIRTIKNEDITIPNAMIMNAHVVNYSARAKEEGLILHTSVTIGYDAPWRTVHELLLEAARKTACILVEPKAFVLQTALNDFYVTYELNAYTDEPREMVNTYSSLHRNIQDSFNEAGVEIMSPHYAQLRDGNRTAIPATYLPPGTVPRSHRVVQVPEDPGKAGDNS
jgi:small-conductance mechanosensitive channel